MLWWKKVFFKKKKEIDPWTLFPDELYFLPEIQWIQDQQTALLIHQSFDEKSLKNCPLLHKYQKKVFSSFQPIKKINYPRQEEYQENFTLLLKKFEESPLKKLVLSKVTQIIGDRDICPYFLLSQLEKKAKNATLFGYFTHPSSSFVGATPEYLYKRYHNNLYTHALAGTAPKQDSQPSPSLLSSHKDLTEFHYVTDFFREKLPLICDSYQSSSLKVVSTATINHLFQEFQGVVKKNTSDQTIINHLHPTPAMGGSPQKEAIDQIDHFENHARGYYSSFLGWFSERFADTLIGIRSAVINKNNLFLFSGSGIVKESHCQSEWQELNLKIAPFLSLL